MNLPIHCPRCLESPDDNKTFPLWSAVGNMFSQIDSNGDGSISKDEFTQFLAQLGANSIGYNSNATNSSQNESNFSITA
jgi:hypothetical protein